MTRTTILIIEKIV